MIGRSPQCYIPSFVEISLLFPEKEFLKGFYHMSHIVRKPAFYKGKNKDADQIRGNPEADQRLCFRYINSTFPLLPIYEISSL